MRPDDPETSLSNKVGANLLPRLIELMPEMVTISRLSDGVFVEVNETFLRKSGYSREEAVGCDSLSLGLWADPLDRERMLEMLKATGSVRNLEVKLKGRSGDVMTGLISGAAIQVGNEGYFLGIVTDISERIRTEQALKVSQRFTAQIVDFLPDPLLGIDAEKRVTIWNRAMEQLTGVAASEMLGKGDHLYTVPFYGMARKQTMDLFWEDLEEIRHKYPYLHREGDTLTIEAFCPALRQGKGAMIWAKATPLRDEDGRLLGAIEVIRDVTERKQAEQALRESEEHYRRMVETASEGIWSINERYQTTYVNRRMAEMLGFLPEEMQGKKASEFMFEEDLEVHRVRMQERSRGQVGRYEQRFRCKDGSAVWCLVAARPLTSEEGMFLGSFAMLTDISEQKRIEQALRESEARFRRTFDESPIGAAIVGLDFRFVRVNDVFCQMLGYSKDELSHVTFKEITHPDDVEEDVKQVARLKAGEIDHYAVDKRYICKDGHVMWGHLSLRMTRDVSGQPLYFLPMVEDITERKKSEEALRKSDEVLRLIANNVSDMITRHDADGTILFTTPSCRHFFGIGPEEMIGKHPIDFIDADIATDMRGMIAEALESGKDVYRSVDQHRRKDGKVLWLETVGKLVRDQEGRFIENHTVVRDITERKMAEDALLRSAKEKEVLLKEIHHRVKNNLQLVSSILSLRAGGVSDEMTLQIIRESQFRIRSMALIHETLYQTGDLARVDIAYYLNRLTKQLLSVRGGTSDAIRLMLDVESIHMDIDVAVPCALIASELISNALSHGFASGCGGTIEVRFHRHGSDYELAVRDDGVGLPEGFVLEKTKSLGLRLVQLLANQLGGTVTIRREAGTEFLIRFGKALSIGAEPEVARGER